MKHILSAILGLSLLFAPVAFMGCNTPTREQAAYKTIYSVQSTAIAAYDEYVSNVIQGNIPTNGVPQVSRAFNQFQASTLVALDAASWNTNAPASAQLSQLSVDLLSLIANFSKRK